jgi:ABC-2 type transport system permease protein
MDYPLLNIAQREIFRIAKGKSSRTLLIYIPLAVFLFLALIYVKGTLRDEPVAVYDADHTPLSRLIIRYIDASSYAKVATYLNSEDDMKNFFLEHDDIHAIYYIPQGTEREIIKGETSKIIVYTNSSNIVFGNLIYKNANTIATTISVGILLKKFMLKGESPQKAFDLAMPIRVHTHALFNSYYNYLYYLLPGLMTVLLQMLLFFAAARSINSEFSENTIFELRKMAGDKIYPIIFGKALAYTLMGLSVTALIGVFFGVFAIPINGNLFALFFLFTYFVITTVFLGLMLSAIIKDEILALDLAFFYNSPAFVFSGFTFPMFLMPSFNSFYADMIPYTHFLSAFFKLYQMNTPLHYIRMEIFYISIFLVIGVLGSMGALKFYFKKQFN